MGDSYKNNDIHECIAFSKKFGDDIVLGKNRDRNYTPELKIVREISGNGVEVCYVQDQDTDWSEGMNSRGIGLVNSALFVKRDEKDYDKSKKKKAPSKDGIRIRYALSKESLRDVVESLVKFDTGVKGHTIVSDGKKVVVIENTSRTKASIKIHDISKPVVRTNHGLEHPEQGYTRGADRISSELRMKNALEILEKENDYKKLFPLFYNHTQNKGPKFDVVRAQNKLWTSSQILMNLNKKQIMLYLIPGAVKFIGVENKLPKNYDRKISLVVREYEHSPHDKYDTFVKTTEKPKTSAIKDKDIKVENFFGLGVGDIPSPSRKAVKKNKTDSMSGYEVEEDWSEKYKRSIDCNNPKGFSQKAHCAGKKKNESNIKEDINIPVKIGDTILTGRFKNKKVVVKSIGKDEHGMPTINGKKVVTFRLPLKEASQASGRQGPKGYKAFVEVGLENEYYEYMKKLFTKNGETMILKEGINDPGILKAVFLAGGPGSGKTWVVKGLFGIPERVNVSQSGMKMVNTDKELKFLLKKYGFGTDLDALPDEVFKNLTDPSQPDYSGLRSYAKELTGVRKKLYMNGRLGMIIDGTGDDYQKIAAEKKELEKAGYDCYMVFVNTTLEVALKRNQERDRVLPKNIVIDSHKSVIKNIGGFQGLFGSNFLIVDNNKDLSPKQAQKRFNMLVKKGITKFINTPVKNPIGKSWIRKQKMLGENYSQILWTQQLTEKIDFKSVAQKIMDKYRVRSKLEFSSRATKGDYDFDRDIIKLRPSYSDVEDFLITLLHEIYHAMDSRRYGREKFTKMYQRAGDIVANKGKDFHDDNPFEIQAERWAQKEYRRFWKNRVKKNN